MSEHVKYIGKDGYTAMLAVLEVVLRQHGGHDGFVEEMAMFLPKDSLEQFGYSKHELPDFFIFSILGPALQAGAQVPKDSILERSIKRYGRAYLYSE